MKLTLYVNNTKLNIVLLEYIYNNISKLKSKGNSVLVHKVKKEATILELDDKSVVNGAEAVYDYLSNIVNNVEDKPTKNTFEATAMAWINDKEGEDDLDTEKISINFDKKIQKANNKEPAKESTNEEVAPRQNNIKKSTKNISDPDAKMEQTLIDKIMND